MNAQSYLMALRWVKGLFSQSALGQYTSRTTISLTYADFNIWKIFGVVISYWGMYRTLAASAQARGRSRESSRSFGR
jgi:hypothetical protein